MTATRTGDDAAETAEQQFGCVRDGPAERTLEDREEVVDLWKRVLRECQPFGDEEMDEIFLEDRIAGADAGELFERGPQRGRRVGRCGAAERFRGLARPQAGDVERRPRRGFVDAPHGGGEQFERAPEECDGLEGGLRPRRDCRYRGGAGIDRAHPPRRVLDAERLAGDCHELSPKRLHRRHRGLLRSRVRAFRRVSIWLRISSTALPTMRSRR